MPNVAADTRGTPEPPGRRRFAIVATADPTRVLELFEAPGWAPAVMCYAEAMRTGRFAEAVSLREMRESEL